MYCSLGREKGLRDIKKEQQEASDKVLTAPNVITFCRLMLIPLFVYLRFFTLHATAARGVITVIFAVASSVTARMISPMVFYILSAVINTRPSSCWGPSVNICTFPKPAASSMALRSSVS